MMRRLNLPFQHLWHVFATFLFLSLLSSTAYAKFIPVSVSSEDNFRNLITHSIEVVGDSYGDDTYIDDAGGDFEFQFNQVKRYVEAEADAIIILSAGGPDQNRRFFPFAKKTPLIFVNVEPLADLNNLPENTVYVGSNEKESGTLQMEELARLAGYKGNVALLIGEANHPAAKMRTKDVKDVIAKYPNMKLVISESGNWQRNQAYKIVSQWIKNKVDFDVLVANNDEMILGGIMALKDAGLNPKNYLTGGIDATQDALNAMKQGELNVTVLQDAANQGRYAVEAAHKLINNQHVDKALWVPFRLVTQNNYQQFLK